MRATSRGRRDGALTDGANILGSPPPARDRGTPAGCPRRSLRFRYDSRCANVQRQGSHAADPSQPARRSSLPALVPRCEERHRSDMRPQCVGRRRQLWLVRRAAMVRNLARESAGGRRARAEGGAHVDKSHHDPTRVEPAVPRRFAGIARLGAVTMAFALILGACSSGATPSPSSAGASTPASSASTAPSESAGGESGAPSESAGESPSGSAGGTGVEPPAGDVAFEFWTGLTGAAGDEMATLVSTFNSENPNVQVTLQRLPEYYTQINNAVAAGTPPAMMIMHIDQLALFAANDVVQPISELTGELGLSADDFSEAVWEGTMWQGEQYSIPLDV